MLVAIVIIVGYLSWWIVFKGITAFFELFQDNNEVHEEQQYTLQPTLVSEQPTLVSEEQEITEPAVYSPITFESYIGQEKAKKIIQTYISKTQERKIVMPHILIGGSAGTGKTTLAEVIANTLQVDFIERIGSSLNEEEYLLEALDDVNGGILFIDEVHALKRDTVEKMYTIMERFKYNGQHVQPFTLIGATTEIGEIMENLMPFYDRFKIVLNLKDYTTESITTICDNYIQAQYNGESLEKEAYDTISNNCKRNPRLGIALSEETLMFEGDVKQVLDNNDIIKEGYTIIDYKLLNYLNTLDSPTGIESIACYLNMPKKTYMYTIEQALLRAGCMTRTPRGRVITDKGKTIRKELEQCMNT